MARKRLKDDDEEPSRKVDWDSRDQFFLVTEEREALGHIRIDDYRLDKILFEALSAHPAFKWDDKENSYVLAVDGPPQPHPSKYTSQASRRPAKSNPGGKIFKDDPEAEDDAIARASDRPSQVCGGKVLPIGGNPRWKGKGGDAYTSKFGYRLERVQDRGEGRLPRGERGKKWRLTHQTSDKEAWFKQKGEATAAIMDGTVVRVL